MGRDINKLKAKGGNGKFKYMPEKEMLELAACGAKILQLRCVEYARRYGVPVHVRSSYNDTNGTIVQ